MSVRAISYSRVSSDKQEIDGASLDTQAAGIRDHAAAQGYELSDEIRDTWTGAEYHEQPGLTWLRGLVRAGGVDVVICYALDGLSRAQTHTAVLVDGIEHHAVVTLGHAGA